MNKVIIYFTLIIFVILLITIFLFYNSNYSILNFSDFKIMITDSNKPGITIPTTNEEYYNKWQCFDIKNIEILEAEIDYNGKHIVPYIQVNLEKKHLQFNVDPVVNLDDQKIIINKWKNLIINQKNICIYGAYLQTDPDGTSVWYIDKIKTKLGYWNFAD